MGNAISISMTSGEYDELRSERDRLVKALPKAGKYRARVQAMLDEVRAKIRIAHKEQHMKGK